MIVRWLLIRSNYAQVFSKGHCGLLGVLTFWSIVNGVDLGLILMLLFNPENIIGCRKTVAWEVENSAFVNWLILPFIFLFPLLLFVFTLSQTWVLIIFGFWVIPSSAQGLCPGGPLRDHPLQAQGTMWSVGC